MTDVPPSRYRVVERDRRLVVIDTQTGETPARVSGVTARRAERTGGLMPKLRARAEGAGLSLPKQTRFDGSATLTTAAFYDDKGPRTVTLDSGAMQMLRVGAGAAVAVWITISVLVPALFFIPLTLLLPNVAKPVRERLTAWLDRYAE